MMFAKSEGIIPAPESTHAVAVAVREGSEGKGGGYAQDHTLQPLGTRSYRPVRLLSSISSTTLTDCNVPDSVIRKSLDSLEKIIH